MLSVKSILCIRKGKHSGMEEMVALVTRGLFVFTISTVLFCVMEIPAVLYVLALSAFLCMMFLRFGWSKNREFYRNLLVGVAANALSFFAVCWSRRVPEDWSEVLAFGGIFFVVGVLICMARKDKATPVDSEGGVRSKESLYEEHKYDFKRMKDLLIQDDIHILGVNSPWGNGKTHVVDCLCQEITGEYYVIKIEALTYRYNEFDRVLIDKLDELLRENGIFSFYTLAFKQTLGNSFWGRFIYHYFYGIQFGNASIFVGLKAELAKLPKKVLIVFEDLERIGNEEAVKRLLSIVERLAGNQIKIVYEYDRMQLQKSVSLNREYLEKYIPTEMNLTDISYCSLVSAVWNTKHLDENPAVHRKLLRGSDGLMGGKNLKEIILGFADRQYDSFGNRFEYGKINFGRNRLTVRRVECFLDDIIGWMRNHSEGELDGQTARVVVAFSFIKHFEDESYEKLVPWKSLDDLFPFQYKGETMGLENLAQAIWAELEADGAKDMKSFWTRVQECVRREENKESFLAYTLFQYRFDDLEIYLQVGGDARKASPQDAKTLRMAREKREKTDRLIWNLLQNGKSEYTDSRACVDKFIHDVLSGSKEDWETAFAQYWSDVYNEKVYKDNQTIYKMGEQPLLTFVREVSYHVHGADFWSDMCDFIRTEWPEKSITREFIELWYWAEIDSPQNMRKMVQHFNSLTADCHFNDQDYYWEFLRKYVGKLGEWGYCNGAIWGLFQREGTNYNQSEWESFVCANLKKEQETLARSRLLDTKEYLETVEDFAAFIGKNIEIIENHNASVPRMPKVEIETHVIYYHQGKMDDLKEELQEPYSVEREKIVQQELNEAFREEDLYPREIKTVKGWIEQWKQGK